MDSSLLIRDREVAHLIGMSVPTVWRLVSKGVLPEPIRTFSRAARWRRVDIEEWVRLGCPVGNECAVKA